ncbi:MAG: hypothetical protein ACRCYC_05580 [Paraclostridium sp.]|uniref:hypothetical protein n=1 Tax=Paraclostridium sp. TaxID=2023273 RepID=UPI003F37DE0F
MKKLVVVLCVLCSGLFFTNPILKSVFANNEPSQNKQVVSIPQKSQDNVKPEETLNTNNATTDVKNVDIEDTTSTNENENNQNDKNKNSDSIKDVSVEKNTTDNNINSENNTEVKENENINLEIVETPSPTTDTTTDESIVVKSLTKEDALKILMDMNPNLTYDYKGDENTFTSLKDKGLSGYVFLPNIDTDLGYFVDKNTSNVYYFHPSGYLEKIK